MRSSNNYILNFRNITIAACFVFFAVNSAQAQTSDFNRIWTTVGSDGTVDEADAGKVFFDHSIVQIGRLLVNAPATIRAKQRGFFFPPESAVIRYNVTPVDGLFVPLNPCGTGTGGASRNLTLRYLATDRSARVVAKLIEVDLATGVETVPARLTFDSNDFPAANGYQVRTSKIPDFRPLDFKLKAYYIEATLTHSRFVGSAAGIQMIKIDNVICIG